MASSTMSKLAKAFEKDGRVSIMSQSKYIEKSILCDAGVPALNIALSGQVDGGLTGGSHQIVGESRTFKCLGGDEYVLVIGSDAYEPDGPLENFKDLFQLIAFNKLMRDAGKQFWTMDDYVSIDGEAHQCRDIYANMVANGEFESDDISNFRIGCEDMQITVSSPNGEQIPILGAIRKTNVEMVEVVFDGINPIVAAKEHVFLSDCGKQVEAANSIGLSFGGHKVVRVNPSQETVAYDIEVPPPYLYVADPSNGVIHHNTNFGLALVKAFLDADKSHICIFGDSERGANKKYWDSFGIDMDRVLHVPLIHVEEMQHKLMHILEKVLDPSDKVCIFIDSVAQLPSKKEYEDSVEQKGTKDMTRAAALNSFWRCITPVINFRDIPLIWINGFYKEIGNDYAEEIYKGGQQGKLSCDNLWFITRSQVKDNDKNLLGWNFNISIRKGRFTKEKLILPITVKYDGGIYRWSALLEICRALGFIDNSGAWYWRTEASGILDEKKRMAKDMDDRFWMELLERGNVVDAVNDYVGVSTGTMLTPIQEEALNALLDNKETTK